MHRASWKTEIWSLLLIALGPATAWPAARSQPELSAAQIKAVARQIATLHSPVDRHVAEGWSNAKKIGELICRPAALPVLKNRFKGVDRVFLGTSAPESLVLDSNQRLTGSGEFRTPHGWQDFTFTCIVDPETAKVTSFQAVLSNTQH